MTGTHPMAVAAIRPGATPAELGIGMRLSIHPHCDRFAEVILGALDEVAHAGHTEGLTVVTDEVSTYVGVVEGPAEQRLVDYLTRLVSAAHQHADGGHVVACVLLSRGCPGEVACDLAVTGLPKPAPVRVAHMGIPAAAQWSLYPLLDGNESGTHMQHIEAAIAAAQRRGVAAQPLHYATLLTGDLAEVIATAADGWAQAGAEVAHVVCHLTVSVGSPSVDSGGEGGEAR